MGWVALPLYLQFRVGRARHAHIKCRLWSTNVVGVLAPVPNLKGCVLAHKSPQMASVRLLVAVATNHCTVEDDAKSQQRTPIKGYSAIWQSSEANTGVKSSENRAKMREKAVHVLDNDPVFVVVVVKVNR